MNSKLYITFSGCEYPRAEELFLKTNQRVERLSEIVFTAYLKILVQFVMLPKCIVSFCLYFIVDRGRDSFYLPIVLW